MSRPPSNAVGLVLGCLLLVATNSVRAQVAVQGPVVVSSVNVQVSGGVPVETRSLQPQSMTAPLAPRTVSFNLNARKRMVMEPYFGQAVPAGGMVVQRPNGELLGLGGLALGIGWLSGTIGMLGSRSCGSSASSSFLPSFSFSTCTGWSAWLSVPVVGAWISLSDSKTPLAVGIVTGLVQLGGLATMIAGGAMTHPMLRYPRSTQRTPSVDWTIVPSSGSAATGISAVGVF